MGVKEDFVGSNILVKCTVFVLLAANLFNWIAFCTSEWGIEYENSSIKRVVGLWRSCTTSDCSRLDGPTLVTDENSDKIANYQGAVQAFAIFGFVGINVAFFLVLLKMFTSKCKRNSDVGLTAVIVCFFSAVCYLISVIVFGSCFSPDKFAIYSFVSTGNLRITATIHTIGYSLYLAVVAFVLALVSGALLVVDMMKGGGTAPA